MAAGVPGAATLAVALAVADAHERKFILLGAATVLAIGLVHTWWIMRRVASSSSAPAEFVMASFRGRVLATLAGELLLAGAWIAMVAIGAADASILIITIGLIGATSAANGVHYVAQGALIARFGRRRGTLVLREEARERFFLA